MRKRSSRRLAGCIAIELLFGLAAAAADSAYRAGGAVFGHARVLALVDRQRDAAVIVNVDFRAPLEIADQIGALAAKTHGLDRSAILIHSTGEGDPAPQDALTAISAALSTLAPAAVRFGVTGLMASTAAGCTLVSRDSQIGTCSAMEGDAVLGPIRSAFRVVDLTHGLQTRGVAPRYATVQAIALGETVLMVSAPANLVSSASGRIVAELPPMDPDARVAEALAAVIARAQTKR